MSQTDKGINPVRQEGSGRKPVIATEKNITKIQKLFNHSDKISQRQASRKMNCSQSHINKILKEKLNMKCYKKRVIPFRTSDQAQKIKKRCQILVKKYKNYIWLLDDESYFPLKHGSLNGNNYFYTNNINEVPSSIRYQTVQKYKTKLLVWICVSKKGVSEPYFLEGKQTLNSETYLSECVKKRLLPFINEHHNKDQYVFWPDLSTIHYAKKILNFLTSKSINFVKKDDNPPNLPLCRPIEYYWALLKGEVYKNNWEAKNISLLKRKIKMSIKKIDQTVIRNMFDEIPNKLKYIQKFGVKEDQVNYK